MYRIELIDNVPMGFIYDENGEYTHEQAENAILCGKLNPTEAEVVQKKQQRETEFQNSEYKRLRSAAYPKVAEYLDGIVKGDEAQVQAYIDACLAVKAKYPKPE